jgi:8-oxo-dGTP pyrophosphatase MutT (NUDIX family)
MNDASDAPLAVRKPVAHPRDAASLILLRGAGKDIEVLLGRRPLSVRFMPGVYVFPGGAIDRGDRIVWAVETGSGALGDRLAMAARAALRETWEEVGVLFGRPADRPPAAPPATAIERAYAGRGLAAALGLLTYVGRAITPSHSRRRFNTRFFLGDGSHVFGTPWASAELEDVRWHPVAQEPLEPLRDVTRFMLARALALYRGTAVGAPPLFYWAKNARRIGICREGAPSGR